jgi:hypothetical protein
MWKCKDYKTTAGHDFIVKKDVTAAHYMANIVIYHFLTRERCPSFNIEV